MSSSAIPITSYPRRPTRAEEDADSVDAVRSQIGLRYRTRRLNRRNILYGLLFIASIPVLYFFLFWAPRRDSSVYVITPTVKVQDYPTKLMPQTEEGRLVFIGDIHGCNVEFAQLLEEVQFVPSRDRLILVGDFISKGPDSIAVMEIAMKNNAMCVRGNHENTLLRRYAKKHGQKFDNDLESGDFNPEEEGFIHILADEKKIIKKATQEQLKFIDSCPMILRMPEKIFGEDHGEVSVCHAGLMWNVPTLEDQDSAVLLYIRTLLPPDNSTASPTRDGILWKEVWNDYQETLSPSERRTVIYGHDAKTGLAIKEFSKGLDSRCYKGDYLTAMVVKRNGFGGWEHDLVSVKCQIHDPKLPGYVDGKL
ncbi:Metallo-dependent phosphatase-like protein [Lipomyces arxii]|uniref:Metallo-dependent phosphatase-like protein n=1 Tax=Lipomyces arxii TaxID=56418 RepID=UPI0034CF78FB